MDTMRAQIKALIDANAAVFEGAFSMIPPSDEEIKKAEQLLGFEIPESYIWFLKEYGYGVFFFEFLGCQSTGSASFVPATLKEKEYGLPSNLLVVEHCDEHVMCINTNDGTVVSWSHYDHDGILFRFDSFEAYFMDCLENAIDNYEED